MTHVPILILTFIAVLLLVFLHSLLTDCLLQLVQCSYLPCSVFSFGSVDFSAYLM